MVSQKEHWLRSKAWWDLLIALASTVLMTTGKTLHPSSLRLLTHDMRLSGLTFKVTLLMTLHYTCCPMSWRDWKGKERGKRRESTRKQVELQNKDRVTREPSLTYSTRKNTWKREAKKSVQREK